jgi:hypothetical protein
VRTNIQTSAEAKLLQSFFLVSLYPLESYSTFFLLAGESPLGAKFWGFSGILNPLAKFGESAIQKSD